MSDETNNTKKVTTKKAVKKTTSTAAPAKKTAPNKKKAATKTAPQTPVIDPNIVPTIQSVVKEMSSDRESRDKQLESLIKEVRDGFSTLSDRTIKQGAEHEKEMTGLYQSLHNAFGSIKDSNVETEELNLNIFKSLSESIMKDHDQSLKEIQEQGKLQDKKIQHMSKLLEQRSKRNRLIAIPGVILALTGIIYMFWVVHIMETAMTSMSSNIHQIQLSVSDMSGKMDAISKNTTTMNSNMQQLSQDMNILSRNVSPAMRGMRNMMPWSP